MNRLRSFLLSWVRRPGAEDLLLITLLTFALTVTLVRLFLGLSGYPQLGGGTLHIAHLLWGGLLLFVAALLPLIFASHRVYRLTAILAGAGVGLFIDEVGKFITQSNDYFFQPAAPIIYAFFLVCVLVYLQVSRPRRRGARLELYAALEYLEEVLERDLEPHERRLLVDHLEAAARDSLEPELAGLAGVLLDFIQSDKVTVVPPTPDLLEDLRLRFLRWETRVFDRLAARMSVTLGLGLLGLVAAAGAGWIVIVDLWPGAAGFAFSAWYSILAVILAATGLSLVFGAVLLWGGPARIQRDAASAPSAVHRLTRGLHWSYVALVLQLTVLDLLLFYYFQFGAIPLVAVQFTLLLAVIYYLREAQRGIPRSGSAVQPPLGIPPESIQKKT
jgi:hypothetical protein